MLAVMLVSESTSAMISGQEPARLSAAMRSSNAFLSTRARKLQNTWPRWSRRACGRSGGREQMFRGPEGLLHGPPIFVAEHGFERVEVGCWCADVGAAWKRNHRIWLNNQSFDHPAQQITFQSYLNAMGQAIDRKEFIDRQIAELVCEWSLGPVVVVVLQALRGVALAVAAGVVAEVGDMRRSTIRASSWLISASFPASARAVKCDASPVSPKQVAQSLGD
jgi:hypothetical protein